MESSENGMKSDFSEVINQQYHPRISDKMAAGAEEFDVEELLEAPYKKEVKCKSCLYKSKRERDVIPFGSLVC